MTVKNVLKGLQQKWNLEEIHIISPTKVLYSGSLDQGWNNTSTDMLPHKKQVENLEVVDRLMFNGRKAFLFVPETVDQ
jgi:hypothetical protein